MRYTTTPVHTNTYSVAALTDRLLFAGRRVFFSTARFFPDRIELSGLTTRGPVCQVISMEDVATIEATEGPANLALHLTDGSSVHLGVKHPQAWRRHFEALTLYQVQPAARLLGNEDQARALAG